MSRQEFRTTDVVRLEVEKDPEGLINLVPNPSGEFGGWGWVTPVVGSFLERSENLGRTALAFRAPGLVPAYFYTEKMPMTPGEYAAASWVAAQLGTQHQVRFEWLDAAGAVLSSSTQSPYITTTSIETANYGPHLAPASTAYVRFRVDYYSNTSGGNPPGNWPFVLMNVTVAAATNPGDLGATRTNLVPNPSFETDVSGWSAEDATLTRATGVAGTPHGSAVARLTATPPPGRSYAHPRMRSDPFEVAPNAVYALQVQTDAHLSATGGLLGVDISVELFDSEGKRLPSGGGTVKYVGRDDDGGWWQYTRVFTAHSHAATGRVEIELDILAPGATVHVDAVMLESGSDIKPFIVGTEAGDLDYIPPAEYISILGPTHDIKVTREALNTSTLVATILDATLDPAVSDHIRPGRRVQLLVENPNGSTGGWGTWGAMFTGRVSAAKVTYDQAASTADKRARIELTAVDNLAALSNQKRTEGVATIDELPYVLEGCGVPWNVNGSGDQVPTATVVAVNENASVVDQIAVTRDSVLGHAWVDRYGVVQVHDSLEASYTADGYNLASRATVTNVDIDYDTERCINEVSIDFLRFNPETLETETVNYPAIRRDEESIRVWGVRSATFTIQGLAEELADLEAFADAVLAANATPSKRVNSLTAAITNPTTHLLWCYWTDLYDKVKVSADFLADEPDIRITRIEHSLTANNDGGKWLMTLGFETDGSVAAPTFVPSPTTGAGGKTIGQLLRPVGEVTMWYGAKADIPASWLPLDGSAIPAEYVDLIALVGPTLPDFTDRFPIGAGTKALGTTGGSPTVAINVGTSSTARNLGSRASAVGSAGGVPLGNGSAGAVEPLDILNPWRALWFVIRAK